MYTFAKQDALCCCGMEVFSLLPTPSLPATADNIFPVVERREGCIIRERLTPWMGIHGWAMDRYGVWWGKCRRDSGSWRLSSKEERSYWWFHQENFNILKWLLFLQTKVRINRELADKGKAEYYWACQGASDFVTEQWSMLAVMPFGIRTLRVSELV